MAEEQEDIVGVEEGYHAWATSYDTDRNPTRDLDAEVMRQVLGKVPARSVLELGCGTGKNTGWLAARFGKVSAADLSEEMLKQAARKHRRQAVSFLRLDIKAPWPFADGSFDLVTCNLVLEHIADLAPLYRQAFRVLSPGGHMFASEIHPYRQLRGAQAQYVSESGVPVRIEAHAHSLAEFVNDAVPAGLEVRHIGEWLGPGDDIPRLLSILFKRGG